MEQLMNYIQNPSNGRNNFEMAKMYLAKKHYAGAISFFLRTAEWGSLTTDRDIIYESLMQLARCLTQLENRKWSEEGWILHAIAFEPTRPEAYFMYSLFHEQKRQWQEAYTDAVVGLTHAKNAKPLEISIGYESEYVLVFQQCIASWWIGRITECRRLLFELPEKYPLTDRYIELVQHNIKKVGGTSKLEQQFYFTNYKREDVDKVRYQFPGIDLIDRNYSQLYQDMFVLAILQGKREGFYLEIGSAEPFKESNTALMETKFGWNGISLDIEEEYVKKFKAERKNPVYCKDATATNFKRLLQAHNAPHDIDYLQLDADPPKVTYETLLAIPFEDYRFAVITYEHDYYADASKKYRDLSRKYLHSQGYVLIVSDVSYNGVNSVEDWWVRPALIDDEILEKMNVKNDAVKNVRNYIFRDTQIDWSEEFKESETFVRVLEEEVIRDDCYQRVPGIKVEEGDTVVDLGASIGIFPIKIQEQNPKMMYCFEPHPATYKTLRKNTAHMSNIVCLNVAISERNTLVPIEWMNLPSLRDEVKFPAVAQGMRLDTFAKQFGVDTIDFLKTDCEGGEYSVFTEENFEWIKNNVKKISGEFHLWGDKNMMQQFRTFRDVYLKQMPNHHVLSVNGTDISSGLWTEEFLTYWSYIYVYIDNR